MRKALIIMIALSFALSMSSVPVLAVTTSLTADTSGGIAPIVKAKWEANGADANYVAYTSATEYYRDDATTAGAQFIPSGVYQVNKKIALCSIVTDPDGLSDITVAPGAVYSDVFYPTDVALGDSHTPLTGQSGLGCGALMQEDKLTKLSKTDGIELFCTNVRTKNPNLPTFNYVAPSTTLKYTYDEICGTEGELMKDKAAVFCTTKDLSYEDPSGTYKVWAVGEDKVGLRDTLQNTFTYSPLTAFEIDFESVAYGNVRKATHKIISGDLTWDGATTNPSDPATVRNVGNTRLQMKVQQNDMGFGMTDGVGYNVKYDARVGSLAAYANYNPNETPKPLMDYLDLSEMDEMDFSIDVIKFPPTHTGDSYTGTMTLSAVSKPHLPGPCSE